MDPWMGRPRELNPWNCQVEWDLLWFPYYVGSGYVTGHDVDVVVDPYWNILLPLIMVSAALFLQTARISGKSIPEATTPVK